MQSVPNRRRLESKCDPGRTRTFNLTIKSRLLCQIELQGPLQRNTGGVKLYRRGSDSDKGILGRWKFSVEAS